MTTTTKSKGALLRGPVEGWLAGRPHMACEVRDCLILMAGMTSPRDAQMAVFALGLQAEAVIDEVLSRDPRVGQLNDLIGLVPDVFRSATALNHAVIERALVELGHLMGAVEVHHDIDFKTSQDTIAEQFWASQPELGAGPDEVAGWRRTVSEAEAQAHDLAMRLKASEAKVRDLVGAGGGAQEQERLGNELAQARLERDLNMSAAREAEGQRCEALDETREAQALLEEVQAQRREALDLMREAQTARDAIQRELRDLQGKVVEAKRELIRPLPAWADDGTPLITAARAVASELTEARGIIRALEQQLSDIHGLVAEVADTDGQDHETAMSVASLLLERLNEAVRDLAQAREENATLATERGELLDQLEAAHSGPSGEPEVQPKALAPGYVAEALRALEAMIETLPADGSIPASGMPAGTRLVEAAFDRIQEVRAKLTEQGRDPYGRETREALENEEHASQAHKLVERWVAWCTTPTPKAQPEAQTQPEELSPEYADEAIRRLTSAVQALPEDGSVPEGGLPDVAGMVEEAFARLRANRAALKAQDMDAWDDKYRLGMAANQARFTEVTNLAGRFHNWSRRAGQPEAAAQVTLPSDQA